MSAILRTYNRPEEIGRDGYPLAWHKCTGCLGEGCIQCGGAGSAKDLVREQAGNRCVRCFHPYSKGDGKWSRCDRRCTHRGPARLIYIAGDGTELEIPHHELATEAGVVVGYGKRVDAAWRILTVHHLTGDKTDLRWWNLAALCQRCHLQIQGKVQMRRIWPWPHTEWFKPYTAGWYAWSYLGEELSREQTMARLDELLALEAIA